MEPEKESNTYRVTKQVKKKKYPMHLTLCNVLSFSPPYTWAI